jgi:nucleoside-diphosphate-sugar epimerase
VKRVLVTGAQGFLGRYVVAGWLASTDVEVLGVGRSDRLDDTFTFDLRWKDTNVPAPLPPELRVITSHDRYSYQRVDVCDEEAFVGVLRAFRPHVIVHGAAALRDAPWEELSRSNVQSVLSIVDAVVVSGRPLPRLILVSSGSVYGAVDLTMLPIREDGPTLPQDLYAVTKLTAENIARIASIEHGVSLVRARVFNLLGPGLQDRHLAASLAGQVAGVKQGMTSDVVEVGSLEATRDFVDVRDASSALMILAERATPGPDAIYNVGSGLETRTQALCDHLIRLADVKVEIVATQERRRSLDVPRVWADIGALRRLGFEPRHDLGESLLDMIRYYDGSVATV